MNQHSRRDNEIKDKLDQADRRLQSNKERFKDVQDKLNTVLERIQGLEKPSPSRNQKLSITERIYLIFCLTSLLEPLTPSTYTPSSQRKLEDIIRSLIQKQDDLNKQHQEEVEALREELYRTTISLEKERSNMATIVSSTFLLSYKFISPR